MIDIDIDFNYETYSNTNNFHWTETTITIPTITLHKHTTDILNKQYNENTLIILGDLNINLNSVVFNNILNDLDLITTYKCIHIWKRKYLT